MYVGLKCIKCIGCLFIFPPTFCIFFLFKYLFCFFVIFSIFAHAHTPPLPIFSCHFPPPLTIGCTENSVVSRILSIPDVGRVNGEQGGKWDQSENPYEEEQSYPCINYFSQHHQCQFTKIWPTLFIFFFLSNIPYFFLAI